jgi:ferredoxin-NADP reductase
MKLKLIKTKTESDNIKSFFFVSDERLSWQPGQYAYITLSDITKQFTIASSPTEDFVQITTNINTNSEFKQSINNLKIGDEIESRLHLVVFLDYNKACNFFLAGGLEYPLSFDD